MRPVRTAATLVAAVTIGCRGVPAREPAGADAPATRAALDSLNARLAAAYRSRDPDAYASLYTDTAVFEWPALPPVRGRAALAGMARDIWAGERDVDLRLRVATRRLAGQHATEVGAFEQSWRDSAGVARTEFGRYVSLLVRGPDGGWRLDRFFGFEDSTRTTPR